MSTDINIKKRIDIQEEGVSITPDVSSINFTGAGVTASAVGQDVTVDITAAAGSILYYMNQTVAQAPYQEFSSTGTTAAEQVVPATVAGGATVTIAAYQTPSGVPNTIVIPQGLWQFFLHFNATTGGQNWIIRPLVYKRDLGGTETLLFSIDPITVTNMSTVTTLYSTESVVPNTILLTTDRIVVKINMENTTGVSQTVNFRTEGSQHYSVATTTLNQAMPTGAVTSVTGTAPVVSSGGTAPAISMAQANGTTDGYLDSADWTTFNNKVDDNIYTADGTVVGTRTVDLNGNTIKFDDGKLGVNITPTAPLHVQTIAVPSTNESIARFTVSDTAGAALTILNASSVDGRFVPEISALQGLNTDIAFKQTSYIQPTQDSGSIPVTIFSTALSTLTAIVTRPLYQFRNAGTSLLTILADGKVGIGTTTPTEKLEVSGKTKTTTFQLTTTPTAGYVLTSDASGNGTWSAAVDVNIYNSDGTVSGARQVDLAGNDLFFNDGLFASTFRFNSDDGSSSTLIDAGPSGISLGTSGGGAGKNINVTTTQISLDGKFTVDNTKNTSGQNLDVVGQTKTTTFQMTTTPVAGYVLTSDASGNGTWSPASAATNIYNTDGTLSADRTVAMNNNQLTFSGGPSATGTQINLSAAANRPKALNFTVGSALRWKQQVSGTEIGGDNGSQLAMLYYDDAGVLKGTAFSISRTNGAFRLNNAYNLPIADGTEGQVMTTDGAGNATWRLAPLTANEIFRGFTFNNNSVIVQTTGGLIASPTATTSAQSVSSTSFATRQIRLRFSPTVVATGQYAGIRGTTLLWFISGGFRFVCDFNVSDTAFGVGCQQFYGMAGQTTDLGYGGASLVQVSTLTNVIGLGSDTLDANLQIIHNDAAGTATKIDLGAAFPANRTIGAASTTVYSLILYNAPNSISVIYQVTNNETGAVATGTLSTNIPLITQGLNIFASRAMGAPLTNTGQFDLCRLGCYSAF
jgi:hypothetical protein